MKYAGETNSAAYYRLRYGRGPRESLRSLKGCSGRCIGMFGARECVAVMGDPVLSYRTIRVPADAALAARNHRDACVATFGDDSRCESDVRYLSWLKDKVEEFPEGF